MVKVREVILERNKKIKTDYQKAVKAGEDRDAVIDGLAGKHEIERFYVRAILKEQGIELERKVEYVKNNKLEQRNASIVEMYNRDVDPSVIATSFNITVTRVRQIIRALTEKPSKIIKREAIQAHLNNIKADIAGGMPYQGIVGKYTKQIIRLVKTVFDFNVFKAYLDNKEKDIVWLAKAGMPSKDIAKKHGITLNYTYLTLHKHGVRFMIKATEKMKRDEKIFKLSKTKSVDDMAEEFGLTPTMIRIIISNKRKQQAYNNDKLIKPTQKNKKNGIRNRKATAAKKPAGR